MRLYLFIRLFFSPASESGSMGINQALGHEPVRLAALASLRARENLRQVSPGANEIPSGCFSIYIQFQMEVYLFLSLASFYWIWRYRGVSSCCARPPQCDTAGRRN